MTKPYELLNTTWNTKAFFYEFIAVFTLVFFIFLWIFYANLLRKRENKVFLIGGYSIGILLMFILPWTLSYYVDNKNSMPLINPLFVILQSVLQGYDVETMQGSPVAYGVPYLITGEILGGLCGFGMFLFIFVLFKNFYKVHPDFGPIVNKLSVPHFTKKDSKMGFLSYAAKEIILISFFVSTVPFVYYMSADYGANIFFKHLVGMVITYIILFSASFVGFFAFHLIFPLTEIIGNTYAFIATKIAKKNGKVYELKMTTKQYLYGWIRFLIATALTIIIPILIAYTILSIAHAGHMTNHF